MRMLALVGLSCLAMPLWAQQQPDAIVLTVNQDGTVTSALKTLTNPETVNAVATYGNSRANLINAKANRRNATANVLDTTVGEGLRTVSSIGQGTGAAAFNALGLIGQGAIAAPFNTAGSIGQGAPAAVVTATGNVAQGSLSSSLNLLNSIVVKGSEGVGTLYNDLKSLYLSRQ